MTKIKFYDYRHSDLMFETEMEIIPRLKERIYLPNGATWKVKSICHNLTKEYKLNFVEIFLI